MHRLPVLLALLLSSATVWAGRPLATDDAGVLDRGTCELEGGIEREAAGADRVRSSLLQFGCGIGLSTQLSVEGGRSRAAGERTDQLALSGKTRLGGSESSGVTSLGYGADWARPAAGGWRHQASSLTLIHSRPLGAVATLHLNLGHARDEASNLGSTAWGVALEHAGSGAFTPVAELYGDDREAPRWNVGLRWTLAAERAWLDASFGRQIAPGRSRLAGVGFTLAF